LARNDAGQVTAPGGTVPPGGSVDIAVVTALPLEMPPALRPRRGGTGGTDGTGSTPVAGTADFGITVTPYRTGGRTVSVASIITGPGTVAAAVGMAALLHRVHPAVILCGGIAGSLKADLPAGAVTIARSCRYWDRDATSEGLPLGVIRPGGRELFVCSADGSPGERIAEMMAVPLVRIATGDSVVTAELLKQLPPAWRHCLTRDADLVDMESAAWVETAGHFGHDPVVCRTVFDMVLTGERALSFRDGCGLAATALERAIPLMLS
jgi:nucleoside phosphorylase